MIETLLSPRTRFSDQLLGEQHYQIMFGFLRTRHSIPEQSAQLQGGKAAGRAHLWGV